LSIPRNPILAKLFRMVRLAENAGYGFDKMESNWKEYMDSEVVYDNSFDSTIVIFPLGSVQDNKTKNWEPDSRLEKELRKYGDSSERLRESFGKVSGKISELLMANPLPIRDVITKLQESATLFL